MSIEVTQQFRVHIAIFQAENLKLVSNTHGGWA